MGKVKWKNW